ncbi:MAG TPA: hypothetical protein VGP19_02245 [Candidatus Acidoferrales bacterium]|jgi:DNA repair photolyase|nr:hypothetical protein [Candidatus Acidoferrales bacterium]
MELDGRDFEKKIYVKRDAGPLARRELGMEKVQGEHIAIGTATDPYQPAEREFGATRAILEQMAARKGLSISITTKSDQVLRDVDLLRRIGEHSGVSVNVSITTLRTRLARILEPRAPRPDLRMRAVQELRRARCRRAVVCRQRPVPHAVGAETISAVSGHEISEDRAAVPRMVFSRGLRP